MRHAARAVVFGLVTAATAVACAVTGFVGRDLAPDAEVLPTAPLLDAIATGDAAEAGDLRYVDVAGDYVLTVTGVKDECAFASWNDAATSVPVTITQNGAEVRALLADLVGVPTLFLLGSNEYVGTVEGDQLRLRIDGSVVGTEGACTFVYDGIIVARFLDGGTLVGDVRYVRVFRAGDCAGLACENQQRFDGPRVGDGGPG